MITMRNWYLRANYYCQEQRIIGVGKQLELLVITFLIIIEWYIVCKTYYHTVIVNMINDFYLKSNVYKYFNPNSIFLLLGNLRNFLLRHVNNTFVNYIMIQKKCQERFCCTYFNKCVLNKRGDKRPTLFLVAFLLFCYINICWLVAKNADNQMSNSIRIFPH